MTSLSTLIYSSSGYVGMNGACSSVDSILKNYDVDVLTSRYVGSCGGREYIGVENCLLFVNYSTVLCIIFLEHVLNMRYPEYLLYFQFTCLLFK